VYPQKPCNADTGRGPSCRLMYKRSLVKEAGRK
jgi:hypothetical protein